MLHDVNFVVMLKLSVPYFNCIIQLSCNSFRSINKLQVQSNILQKALNFSSIAALFIPFSFQDLKMIVTNVFLSERKVKYPS